MGLNRDFIGLNAGKWAMILGVGVVAASGYLAWFGPQAIAQNGTFPDTTNHWSRPFVESLKTANIVEGYPDGTFRPDQAIDRDEYAAILRDAFEKTNVRQIPTASRFNDVPKQYWAASAIEEVYETGLMNEVNQDQFKPRTAMTRAEGLAAIARALDLDASTAVPVAKASTTPTVTSQNQSRNLKKRQPKAQLLFPLASTSLMGLFAPPAKSAAPSASTQDASAPVSSPANPLAYFTDADQLSPALRNPVAEAATAGLVVNHPNPKQLQPNAPLERGNAAAFIHQALVYQNRLAPLDSNAQALQYVAQP